MGEAPVALTERFAAFPEQIVAEIGWATIAVAEFTVTLAEDESKQYRQRHLQM